MSETLSSGNPSEAIRARVMRAAKAILGKRRDLGAVYEHGHWWILERGTGNIWDCVDAEGGSSVDGFDFEPVS